MNAIMKRLKDMSLTPSEQQFDLSCSLKVDVRLNSIEKFLEAFDKVEGCRIERVAPLQEEEYSTDSE